MFRYLFTVAVVALMSVTTAPIASADTVGAPCDDWMKIGTDAASGESLFCGAQSSPATALTWQPWSSAAWGTLTTVGKAGTLCNLPPYTFGRSPDGYVVWCFDGPVAFLPGGQTIENPSTPVWSIYSP